jgi:uncharacterized protein
MVLLADSVKCYICMIEINMSGSNLNMVNIMVKMPPEVKETLEKQRVLPLSTASSDGKPNVIYIGILKILDDETLVLSDNYFNKTAKNLEVNPWVAIVCWDQEKRRSYQLKCQVISIEQNGPVFEDIVKTVAERNKSINVRRAIKVKVVEIYEAISGPKAGERIA